MENIDFDPIESNKHNLKEKGNVPKENIENGNNELTGEGDLEDSYFPEDDGHHDDYGTSGEKYGWYNGWSDDVIDDAFEGDPENTWNVD